MEFFCAKNIIKNYSNHLALDQVSITVNKGSIFGLLGPNGAGKTTLLRIINQITAPDSGVLIFKGKKLNQEDILNIGYLPEERGLYKKMKVGEQTMYLAQLKGLAKKEAFKRLSYWFSKFEIQGWWNKKIEELSKGMQQKVQFISTVVHEPELLIFDEPFAGFDPINANLLKNEILELRNKGATVIFSTHNMESVEELCDHITLLNKSKNILSGEINNIKNQYKSGIYELIFDGDYDKFESALNSNFNIIEKKKNQDNNYTVRIKSNKKLRQNELLSSIISVIHINSYFEVIPSMNDVFIKVVESQN
ncbi:MAG: ATP-binding cassette domain-containing protein [Bacteroidales bacterium]|nr:ATP-binding cassette domain-containing protein [Bacteroidales bacterium]